MAFEYTPYRNPYIGTIADLMARGEDAKAKMLVDVASAQARAAEAKGQIYGNAIQNIGQSASKALSDYTLEKQNAPIRAQEAEMRAMTLAAARDNQQIGRGKEFLASTMNPPDPNYQKDPVTGQSPLPGPPSPDNRDIYKPGPYGSKFMDPNLAQQRLVDAGFGAHLEALMPIVEKQNARNSAFVAGKNRARGEYARDALTTMHAGVPWAQALELAGHSGVENGVFDANELADLTRQGEGQPPAAQQAILFNIMRQGGAETTFETPGQRELLGGIPTGRDTGEKPKTMDERLSEAYATPPERQTPEQQALIRGDRAQAENKRPAPAPPVPGSMEDRVLQGLALQAQKLGRPLTKEETFQTTTNISRPPLSSNLTTGQVMMAGRFADDFNRDSKDYLNRLSSYSTIRQAGSPENASAAGDLVLIFAFMKMVDPTSTVRESEQASAQNTAGVPERIRTLYNKMLKGERLSKEQRLDFIGQSETIFRDAQKRQRAIATVYGDRAERAGLDRRDVVIDFDTIFEVPLPGAKPTGELPKTPTRPSKGN